MKKVSWTSTRYFTNKHKEKDSWLVLPLTNSVGRHKNEESSFRGVLLWHLESILPNSVFKI